MIVLTNLLSLVSVFACVVVIISIYLCVLSRIICIFTDNLLSYVKKIQTTR